MENVLNVLDVSVFIGRDMAEMIKGDPILDDLIDAEKCWV